MQFSLDWTDLYHGQKLILEQVCVCVCIFVFLYLECMFPYVHSIQIRDFNIWKNIYYWFKPSVFKIDPIVVFEIELVTLRDI